MKRSYYSNSISDFITESEASILGKLSMHHSFALESLQKNAWHSQIQILKTALSAYKEGRIYFEFAIPRMGKRVDNILLINDLIFVIEFKVGETLYTKHALNQAIDYCLDLANFHEGSHDKKIIPILIATKAVSEINSVTSNNHIFDPVKTNKENFSTNLQGLILNNSAGKIDADEWENSIYKPTPTIIEAAQALYKGHNVKEISRSDAGAINLSKTASCIKSIIESSKLNHRKSICFLTGVPGAGKTLAGLNIANERMKADENEHAVFLSGNGPLVYVLREALTRDEVLSIKEQGGKATKKLTADRTHAFIQNIHHFRDDNLNNEKAPIEKVVVFDEAQRAWEKEQVSSFMKRKKGIEDFNMSEPEYLIGVMNRHSDWCTIICLIGGGQEINTGEAGVAEWIKALKSYFNNWDIHYSNLFLTNDTYLADEGLRVWLTENGISQTDLHLSVSVRSFRSENVSMLIHEILEGNKTKAAEIYSLIKNDFPILLTRNLDRAKLWLKNKARGSERFGIIASSGGKRLRPCGLDVNNTIDAPNWFLNEAQDVRSSNHLEDVVTEFDIQGLEIDWTCLAWDINFYYANTEWKYQKFKGTKWQRIKSEEERNFLKNTYRVLLTRARQGIVIFIPYGDNDDITRPITLYDSTYEFLKSCGFEDLS